ncbi:zinc-binding dehydrogenase [Blastomyces gilchristii SLH14081]|uniref:Zinc-binding dehydrogenase n=1 Tax=Blastomyces gilchristii (strain SLH14081) TaxID=559298 RepID=A0A179V395_BLAGS|nr:zinc-binding dehydrogenase [Blastomyces gilchristii SLH14081]OAT14523.1 zinc-binding dehydrogenase [Blastomyces gilchristii SLH14081]
MEPEFPLSYKVARFEAKGEELSIRTIPLEYPKHREILVKVLACGVCHSDVLVRDGEAGNSFPIIPGHEIVGSVQALGPGVKNFKIGERVGGPWHGGHDGVCKECNRGYFQLCDNEKINGVTRPGGFAEYCILRVEAVARLPQDMDPAEIAPLLCAGMTTFNGIRKMEVAAGDLIAIHGLGGLGHLAVQFANKLGYKVAVISSKHEKENFARELGAHHFINSSKCDIPTTLQEIGGAAMAILSAPIPKYVQPLMQGLAPRGRLLVLSPIGEFTVDSALMIRRALSVSGWLTGHALDAEEVIDFARTHDVKCMIQKYKLDDVNKAMDDLVHARVRFRPILVMD